MRHKYAEIFCWKNVSIFCCAKATHIFSAKNIRILYIESAKTVNEMTLNELINLTMFWTTGPSFVVEHSSFASICLMGHSIRKCLCANVDNWKPRSAWASTQSDQVLHFPLTEALHSTECMNGTLCMRGMIWICILRMFRDTRSSSYIIFVFFANRYDYTLAREYNWNVKNKLTRGYEETYFMVFREDGCFYDELETRWGNVGIFQIPEPWMGQSLGKIILLFFLVLCENMFYVSRMILKVKQIK